MSRAVKYKVGDVVNGYKIAARVPDSRRVWVQCAKPGCTEIYETQMTGVLQQRSRRFCHVHQGQHREEGWRKLVQERQAKRMLDESLRRAALQAQSVPDVSVVYGKVMDGGVQSLMYPLAVRWVSDESGAKWRGFVNDGKCFGWYMVIDRKRSEGGSVHWQAMCSVCGHVRGVYDAQLKRREAIRCQMCMGSPERYELAKTLYRRAVDSGFAMENPHVLLKVAAGLARKFEDEACIAWTCNAVVTFEALLKDAEENARLQAGDDAPDMVEVERQPEIDWHGQPITTWPLDVLLSMRNAMTADPSAALARYGNWAKVGEVAATIAAEIEKRKELKDEA